MAKIINRIRKTDTTISGSANIDFSFSLGAFLRQIIVKFASSDTTFDVSIVDVDGDTIYYRDNESGVLNELIELPMHGNYTLQIRNASKDENFTVQLIAHEI